MKLISFCSGCGGLDHGILSASKSTLVYACENNKYARATLLVHHPTVVVGDDIMKTSAAKITSDCQLTSNDVLLCVGGVPCPSFSTIGKRKALDDPRGACMTQFFHVCVELKAKYIVLENVRGLLTSAIGRQGKGSVLKYFIEFLEKRQYSVSYQLYDAKYFGVPQTRDRVILVAVKNDKALPFLSATHGLNGLPRFQTLGDVIKTLPDTHDHTQFPQSRLKYFAMLAAGQHWRHLPKEHQLEAVGAATLKDKGGNTGVFRRLSYDNPSPTLLCSPTSHKTALCHPEKVRPLSIQEYKRIQGFPDDYVIKGSLLAQYRQLGNAVPIRVGMAIGKLIQEHIDGQRRDCVYIRLSLNKAPAYFTVHMQR